MKKLSEIGQQCSRHPEDGGLIPFDSCLDMSVRIFTPAELLEAYRIVWEAAHDAMREGVSLPHFTTFEDFLKDNGL